MKVYPTWEYDCRFHLKELYAFPVNLEEGQDSIQNGISPLGTCCASLPVLSQKKIQLGFSWNILVMNG